MRNELRIQPSELSDLEAVRLIQALNEELEALYPEEGANHFELSADQVAHGRGAFLVVYLDAVPVGCGAVRVIGPSEAEIKRMYVVPGARGKGISRALLAALEDEARRLGVTRLLLETGERQAAALGLYANAGFERIEAFGEYANSPLSVCMAKTLLGAGASEPGRVLIRDATVADLPAIVALHNALIPTTTITWTEDLDTLEHRALWFERQLQDGHPVLVADDAGEVVGFTTYEHFRGEGKWPGYRTTAELSIHVRESHWGRGAGRALVEALAERGQAAGIHVLVAGIDAGNEASIRFHERLGFVEVARMPEVGQKFGRWLDLVLMQRAIDGRTRP